MRGMMIQSKSLILSSMEVVPLILKAIHCPEPAGSLPFKKSGSLMFY